MNTELRTSFIFLTRGNLHAEAMLRFNKWLRQWVNKDNWYRDLIRPWHPRFSDAIADAPSYDCPRMFSIGIASKRRISVSLSAVASPVVLSIFAKSMNSSLIMAGSSLLSRNLRHSTKTSLFAYLSVTSSAMIEYKPLPCKPFRILPVIWLPMIWITSFWMVLLDYKACF